MRPLDWQDLQHLMSTQVCGGHEEVLRIRDTRSVDAGVRSVLVGPMREGTVIGGPRAESFLQICREPEACAVRGSRVFQRTAKQHFPLESC